METVFGSLGGAVEGSPVVALSAAFAWGLVSVLLSPCHLASIPLIVGFMSEQKGMTVGRAFCTALLIGFVYGVALGPCTFAYMAPVLAVAFKTGAGAPLFAAGLFAAFGLGHCAVITAAGTSVRRVQEYLRWSEDSRAVLIGRRVCGALVLAGALFPVHGTVMQDMGYGYYSRNSSVPFAGTALVPRPLSDAVDLRLRAASPPSSGRSSRCR